MSSSRTVIQMNRTMHGDIQFSGKIDAHDLFKLKLDPVDQMVLDDCSKPTATGADWLLGLELIFRRLNEQSNPAT